jgi:biotin synthase-related radical SAM superfamily protein
MKKTFVITIDVDDAKVQDSSGLDVALGIHEDRAKELTMRCVKDMEASKARGDDKFNSLEWCLKMIEEDKLTGNEILYYIQGGYNAVHNMKRAAMQLSPLASLFR